MPPLLVWSTAVHPTHTSTAYTCLATAPYKSRGFCWFHSVYFRLLALARPEAVRSPELIRFMLTLAPAIGHVISLPKALQVQAT